MEAQDLEVVSLQNIWICISSLPPKLEYDYNWEASMRSKGKSDEGVGAEYRLVDSIQLQK